jgi:phage tail-like protein
MSTAALLPRPAQPPHDPLSLRLSGTDGWRPSPVLEDIEVDARDGALRLRAVWPPGLGIDDPWGSLGGLILPRHVGLAPDGTVYLLDVAGRRLLRLDPCACRFAPLPCIVPPGGALRAIAATDDRLYLAAGDAVWVLHRQRLAILAKLEPGYAWQPTALAIDASCGLWVGDPLNGAVHHFDRLGRWRRRLEGLGAVQALAFDRDGRLHVGVGATVQVLDANGSMIETIDRPEALVDRFPPLPFVIDAKGRMALGELCRAHGAAIIGDGLFDAAGNPVTGAAVPFLPGYAASGRYLSLPLDSRIHRCQWHRFLLRMTLPKGTRLTMRTRTADLDLPLEMVQDATDSAWSPAEVFTTAAGAAAEALIARPHGRYLWLELSLVGHGDATPRLQEIVLEFPRISLRRYLPGVWGDEPVAADLTDRLLAIFDTGLRSIEGRVDRFAEFLDPRTAPASSPVKGRPDALTWLASWVGLTFAPGMAEAERRRLLREAPKLYALRGTPEGLRRMLILYLGLARHCPRPRTSCGPTCGLPGPCPWQPPRLLLEHWRLRRWLFLGQGRLGEQSQLWGERILGRSRLGDSAQAGVTRLATERDPLRDPFHMHAHRFSVFLPAARARRPADRRRLEQLIRAEAPAHTKADVYWVEPRMRLGIQAMLGLDSALGRWPASALTLDEGRLGRASLIGGNGVAPTAFSLGHDTRVGRTTRLG